MLISFLVCDGEPEYLAFNPPLKSVLLATILYFHRSSMAHTIVLIEQAFFAI
jgi:hypothetical protein